MASSQHIQLAHKNLTKVASTTMNLKRDLSAFHQGQQNTQGSADHQKEDSISRPKKVAKIVNTEPTDKPNGGNDHMASRCIGPWDPVSGTIKVCVLCNDASHGLDNCSVLAKRSASDQRFVLSRYLIIYRGGRPPIESSVCWVDLLSSTEYKEVLAKHSSEKGDKLYPWTRAFAISQHTNKLWKRYSYSQGDDSKRTWWPEDPKTNSEAETESASVLKAAARQKMMESESEREWELTAAGLKAWPDIFKIAPKLKAFIEKEDN
ncbi:hypothetical protein NEUTE2DRAFT_132040 [Neurospora tetrasperma FGSC 2509]|nr:hypothetical protein NEUTE2DRAFT_132040 [Neurospora tetrasperma FGSC 2509]